MTKDEQDSFMPFDRNDNSEDAQWIRSLIETEANVGAAVGKIRSQESEQNIMGNVQLIEGAAHWEFTEWFLLKQQQIRTSYEGGPPDYPGIYDLGIALPIPRLNGESEIFYIGRGAGQTSGDRGTVAGSLHRHIVNGCGPEKWLRTHRPDQALFARFAIAENIEEARYWEKLRLRWFIEQHWELPIGNTNSVASHPMGAHELVKVMREWEDWAYRRKRTN